MSGTTTQTVGGLITLALKMAQVVGDGQSIQASDVQDALALLNQMTASWNAQRWLAYALQDIACTSTGAKSYTIGTGESINVPRPDRLEAAYMRQFPQNAEGYTVDFPVRMLSSYEDYSRIAVKNLPSFARIAFYDAAYPVGNVYFWPNPLATQYELHVLTKAPLPQFSKLTDAIGLPPPYLEALLYNLVVRLKSMYGLPVDQVVVALATTALNTIRNSNAQVPTLRIDPALVGVNGGGMWYNPFSDQAG